MLFSMEFCKCFVAAATGAAAAAYYNSYFFCFCLRFFFVTLYHIRSLSLLCVTFSCNYQCKNLLCQRAKIVHYERFSPLHKTMVRRIENTHNLLSDGIFATQNHLPIRRIPFCWCFCWSGERSLKSGHMFPTVVAIVFFIRLPLLLLVLLVA